MSNSIAGAQIEHNGKTMALSEWVHELGLPYVTVRMRYTRGVRDPQRLFAPTRFYRGQRPPNEQPEPQPPNHTLLDDLFGFDMARRIRAVGEMMSMAPVDVVREMVKHGVEKVEKRTVAE